MKITQHGLYWVAQGEDNVNCPECKSDQIKCKINKKEGEKTGRVFLATVLYAKCICTNCGCEFEHERELPDADASG